MREVVDTYTVYSFDELEDDIQDKVVEKHADVNVDYEWWDYDGLLCLTDAEMKSRHIQMSDNWWESDKHKNSLGNIIGEYPAHTGLFSYSRIYFDIDRNNYIQFPDLTINCDETFRKFLRIPKRLWSRCDYRFESHRYGYNEGSTRLVIEPELRDERTQDYREPTERQQAIIDRAMEIMNEKIDEALSDLQKTYDHLTSEEAIIETLKANEYEFTAEGEIAS